jgi:FkbM family methyltransferase
MALLKSLIKFLQVLDQQGLKLFKNLKSGFSLSSYQILENVAHHCNDIGTVIDVGANQGQFALATTHKFPNAKIISFEPLPDLYARFNANVQGNKNITAYNLALGNETGTIDFYRNEHSHASSVLPISHEQVAALPETSKTAKTQVKISKLDDVVQASELIGKTLLKLDVQGYEKNVLEGAPKLLSAVDFVLFEASFIPMYEGEPLFEEMHAYLNNRGYAIVGPVGFLQGKDNSILQMDFLYRNIKPA